LICCRHKARLQGRSQNFIKGTRGDLGEGSPPAELRGTAPVGIWGLSPQKPEKTFENIPEEIDENTQIMKWSHLLIMH